MEQRETGGSYLVMDILARLRALLLLLAFGLGRAGQATAAPLMTMPASPPETTVMAMAGTSDCPGCPGGYDLGMSPACAATSCPATMAVSPQGPIVEPIGRTVFAPVYVHLAQGVSTDPEPHPPKSILH